MRSWVLFARANFSGAAVAPEVSLPLDLGPCETIILLTAAEGPTNIFDLVVNVEVDEGHGFVVKDSNVHGRAVDDTSAISIQIVTRMNGLAGTRVRAVAGVGQAVVGVSVVLLETQADLLRHEG